MEAIQELKDKAHLHASRGRHLSQHVTALMYVILALMVVSLCTSALHYKQIAAMVTSIQFVLLAIQMIIAARGAFHLRKANKLLDQAILLSSIQIEPKS